ncbi:ATP-binding cassette domain-containing protein [Lacihabitans sp. LS3-19]|uniref:ABC transporter transmembrane domain-containing protein n=1 Tax=Lacihabitans sp. LS3-19 TaxID=2487335 RepID=UPI0020CE2693|nr:ABC transporter transmembrane domain-containing protein [Lacihabitans sp. LS3-19]MCP9767936.1 ATP-binding cassette domain-containing protein [Lacihabitans sp. LS3-19]
MEKPSILAALSKIFKLLWLDKQDITAIYFYSIFAGLVSLSLPLGIQTIIGFVQAGSLSTSIIVLIILVLIGTFIGGFLQVKQLELIEKIEQKLYFRYTLDYAERLPRLNIEKLEGYYLPEIVNRYFDLPSLQKSLHKLLVDIPAAFIQILFGIILLSFYHPLFIAFGLILFTAIFLIIRSTSKGGFQTSLETSDYKYKIAAWLQEMARGIKTFKYSQNSHLHLQKADNLLSGYLKARTSHFEILKIQFWILIVFKTIIVASMLILGVVLLIQQQINIGQFIAADIVIIVILTSVEKMISNLDQIYESLTSVEKLDKISKAAIEDTGSSILEENNQGLSVEFRDVYFKYKNEEPLIDNLNFKINSGEWVLLKGNFGSGKSTVFRLLGGVVNKQNGQVLINDLPIGSYDLASLRNQMGILSGNQEIFDGTLYENITLGNKKISLAAVQNIIKLTGLDVYVNKMEKGINTPLMPFGLQLASKIKYQILLCRALILPKNIFLIEDPFKFYNQEQFEPIFDFLKERQSTVIMTSNNDNHKSYFNQIIELKN